MIRMANSSNNLIKDSKQLHMSAASTYIKDQRQRKLTSAAGIRFKYFFSWECISSKLFFRWAMLCFWNSLDVYQQCSNIRKRSLLTHCLHVLDQMAGQQRMHAPTIGSEPWVMSGTHICFRGQANGGSYLLRVSKLPRSDLRVYQWDTR